MVIVGVPVYPVIPPLPAAAFAFLLHLVYFHTRQRLVVLSRSTSPQNTSFL